MYKYTYYFRYTNNNQLDYTGILQNMRNVCNGWRWFRSSVSK